MTCATLNSEEGALDPKLIKYIRSTFPVRTNLKRLWKSLYNPPLARREGVLFIGYAEGDLGLGQGFRNELRAVELASLPFAIYPFRLGIETRLLGPFMPERYDLSHAYPVNIIEVAPDQLQVVLQAIDRRLTCNSYNILRTFWELPEAPDAWRSALSPIHEIWAPNTFVANAFRSIFSGSITVVPQPVDVGTGDYPTREQLGMESHRLYFLFSFDYNSSPYRKNPLGVLRAFQAAFPQRNERVGLIIKTNGVADHYPAISTELRNSAKSDGRIAVIEKSLSRQDFLGLIRACDVYLSLHRSEGFGLGMVESMSFGRIVIGTNFSGNTDYLTDKTGFPIPFHLRAVAPHEYPWSDGQVWAEPDLDAAVSAMQLVFQSPELARKRASAGQKFVHQTYAPHLVGQLIKSRISQLTKDNTSR